jgi:hypothetical protein
MQFDYFVENVQTCFASSYFYPTHLIAALVHFDYLRSAYNAHSKGGGCCLHRGEHANAKSVFRGRIKNVAQKIM